MIEICQYRYKGTQLRLTSRYMEKKLYFFFKSIFKEYVTSLWTPPPPCAQYSHRQLPSGKKTIKTSHGIYTVEKFNNRDAEWLKNRYVDLPVAPSWFITKLVKPASRWWRWCTWPPHTSIASWSRRWTSAPRSGRPSFCWNRSGKIFVMTTSKKEMISYIPKNTRKNQGIPGNAQE